METTFSVRIILIFASVLALVCNIIGLFGHGWFRISVTTVYSNVTVTQKITQGLFYVSPYVICIDQGNGTRCKTLDEMPLAERFMVAVMVEFLHESLQQCIKPPKALAVIGIFLLMSSIVILCKYICMKKKSTSEKSFGISCAVLFAIAALVDIICAGIHLLITRKINENLAMYGMQGSHFEGHMLFPWPVLVLVIVALLELVAGFVIAMTTCGKQYNNTVIRYKELKDNELLLNGDNNDA